MFASRRVHDLLLLRNDRSGSFATERYSFSLDAFELVLLRGDCWHRIGQQQTGSVRDGNDARCFELLEKSLFLGVLLAASSRKLI